MSHRKMGQLSLAESIIARRKPKHWLQEVYEQVDWEGLARPRRSCTPRARDGSRIRRS